MRASPEDRAIASLRRLAKRWPRSLVLFIDADRLFVMQADEDGAVPTTVEGGPDQSKIVESIPIRCGSGCF